MPAVSVAGIFTFVQAKLLGLAEGGPLGWFSFTFVSPLLFPRLGSDGYAATRMGGSPGMKTLGFHASRQLKDATYWQSVMRAAGTYSLESTMRSLFTMVLRRGPRGGSGVGVEASFCFFSQGLPAKLGFRKE